MLLISMHFNSFIFVLKKNISSIRGLKCIASDKKLLRDTINLTVTKKGNTRHLHELIGFVKAGQHRVIRIYHNCKNKTRGMEPPAL